MTFDFGWPRERVPKRCRTLVAKDDAIWFWPGIPLTLHRGAEILPIAAENIRFWITRLHGPEALDFDILRAIEKAAQRLREGDEATAQAELDALRLKELSEDGSALMCAVAEQLDVPALDLPLRQSMRTWNAQDIARLLPMFRQYVETARPLRKGPIPFDPSAGSDFDSKHPRWPAGAPDSHGGQFAPKDEDGASFIPAAAGGPPKPKRSRRPQSPQPPKASSADEPGIRFIEPGDFPDGENPNETDEAAPKLITPDDLRSSLIGHNSGNPIPMDVPPDPLPEPPPEIPDEPLPNKVRYLFIKAAVTWITRALFAVVAPELATYLAMLQTVGWVARMVWPFVFSSFDPPETMEQLQADALIRQPGYEIHHPVEQAQARQEGYPKELWDGFENRVRVPTLKHWLITGWYMSPNDAFGGLSPREYLKGKPWAEKTRVGRIALEKFWVLKP